VETSSGFPGMEPAAIRLAAPCLKRLLYRELLDKFPWDTHPSEIIGRYRTHVADSAGCLLGCNKANLPPAVMGVMEVMGVMGRGCVGPLFRPRHVVMLSGEWSARAPIGKEVGWIIWTNLKFVTLETRTWNLEASSRPAPRRCHVIAAVPQCSFSSPRVIRFAV
jgi:hypothetical protein